MSGFPRIRATFIVLAIAIVGWLGYGVYNLVTAPEVSRLGIFGTIARTDTVRLGGSFSLIDQNGRRRSDGEFRGQLMLIYFGYTYCPDVCPTSVQIMTEALETLGENGNLVRPIFITVDPARDTVNVMREYAENFHPRLVALTGPEADIAEVTRAYRVYYARSEESSSEQDYLVDHSSFIYLMGADGRYLTHFGHDATPEEVAAGIREFL